MIDTAADNPIYQKQSGLIEKLHSTFKFTQTFTIWRQTINSMYKNQVVEVVVYGLKY